MQPKTRLETPRQRPGVLDRLAGVAAQFYRSDGGYMYRKDRIGAPIPVSAAERDMFVADANRALLLHVLAFAVACGVAWLISVHVFPYREIAGAILLSVIATLSGIALFGSFTRASHAPARALSARRPAGPPTDPVFGEDRVGYWGYALMIAIGVVWAVFQIDEAPRLAVGLIVAMVLGGAYAMLRKWRFESRLTPQQWARWAAEDERRRDLNATEFAPGKAVLLVVFLIVEMGGALFAFGLTLSGVIALAGATTETANLATLLFAFVMAGAISIGWVYILEKLCRRWTGMYAMDAFAFLPPNL